MAKITSISMSRPMWTIAEFMMRRGGYESFSEYVRDLIRRDHRQAIEDFEASENRRIEQSRYTLPGHRQY